MKFGVTLPTTADLGDRGALLALAEAAEFLGFDSVWVPDHIVIPAHPPKGYPYGTFNTERVLESTAMMGAILGRTQRVSIGTNVLILPLRDPLILARQLATMDCLSPGRIILGVGVGWMREEFDAIGKDFRVRGAMADEYIEVMRECWSADPVSFDGRFVSFEDLRFLPLPEPPGIPIFVGGHSKGALRRVGRHGDGWNAWRLTFAEMERSRQEIAGHARDAGRDVDAVAISLSEAVRLTPDRLADPRRSFQGHVDQVRDDIAHAEEFGLSLLNVILKPNERPEKLITHMATLASDVFDLHQNPRERTPA